MKLLELKRVNFESWARYVRLGVAAGVVLGATVYVLYYLSG